jgi:hypothetical protein
VTAGDDGDQAPATLEKAIEDAVRAAIDRNPEGVRDAVMRATEESFPAGLGYACFSWARIAAAAIVGSPEQLEEYTARGMSAGVQFADGDGAIMNAEDTHPAVRFVGRMVACALNDDHRAAIDVWATLDDDVRAQACVEMVNFAASMIVRRALVDMNGTPGRLM